MAYAYRHLAAVDVPVMRQLLAVFAAAFNDPESYQGAPPADDYLKLLLGKSHFIAIAAVDTAGTVVGGLAGYELEKFEQARSEIYIYDLAVAEQHRRRGIARGLIRTLQGIAQQRGAWVIFVQADPGDDPAIRLYTSLGAREDVHHFDIPVR